MYKSEVIPEDWGSTTVTSLVCPVAVLSKMKPKNAVN
jgi:hypothetical protein